jgi:flagellar assembly protein FliH
LQQTKSATGKDASGRIEVFEYLADPAAPALPEWEGFAGNEEAVPKPAEASAHAAGSGAVEAQQRAEFDRRLAEETRRSFESGRERGHQEGRKAEQEAQVAAQSAAQTAAEQQRTQQAAGLLASFAQARDRFLQTVEHEVVKLALAVAARILRREAQMDPLLLTGAVRVALGQLSGSTQVRLRVPELELDLWTEAIALLPNLAVKPVVSAGEGMRLGDCVIETELGSVDLGIRSQLGEIERGFFDRAGGSSASAVRANVAQPAVVGSGATQESRP